MAYIVVRASDSQSKGRGFDSWPFSCHVLAKLCTHMRLSYQAIQYVIGQKVAMLWRWEGNRKPDEK